MNLRNPLDIYDGFGLNDCFRPPMDMIIKLMDELRDYPQHQTLIHMTLSP